jgi:hypothetical protein
MVKVFYIYQMDKNFKEYLMVIVLKVLGHFIVEMEIKLLVFGKKI